jgi:RNA-binding protein
MILSETHKKFLRGKGHLLKPIITISSQGLSQPLLDEFDSTITHHELIKIKVRNHDKASKNTIFSQLCEKTTSMLVGKIGNIALIYRPNKEDQKIKLPK